MQGQNLSRTKDSRNFRSILFSATMTYNCWLQGFSLKPMILNSMFRCLALTLKFFNIFFACTLARTEMNEMLQRKEVQHQNEN